MRWMIFVLLMGCPSALFAQGVPGAGGAAPASSAAAKLPADPVLRSAMKEIRAATLDAHTLVTHRRMPPEMAERYRVRVKLEIARIRSESARPPEAAAALEPALRDIESGAEAVAARGNGMDPISGIIAIDEALAGYGLRFDDPDWQPLR